MRAYHVRMRFVLHGNRCLDDTRSTALVAFAAVVGGIVTCGCAWLTVLGPHRVGDTDVPLHLVMLAVLGTAMLAWTFAVSRRWLGSSTGTGFWVAAFALAMRANTDFIVTAFLSTPTYAYDDRYGYAPLGTLVWLGRNVGLAAFAFGLAFVALSCWADRRMRARAPAWAKPFV